jgi:hypothetical protein
MKAISLLLALALFAPLAAQNPNSPPRPRGGIGPSPNQQQFSQDSPGIPLPEANFTISLEGTLTSGTAVDLQLTGSGPTFHADQIIGDDGTVVGCQYTLSKTEKGYRVSYNIATQVRIATNIHRGETETVNYEFRSVSLSGAVLCTPGAPIVIARSGGKPLRLTLAEVPAAATPGVEPQKTTSPEPSR